MLAEHTINEQKPLVDFVNKVSGSNNLINMNKMAKLLQDEHIDIGCNRLFQWLRQKKILMQDNMPYQQYVDNGYFKVTEFLSVIRHPPLPLTNKSIPLQTLLWMVKMLSRYITLFSVNLVI